MTQLDWTRTIPPGQDQRCTTCWQEPVFLETIEAAERWIVASGIPVHPPAAIVAWLEGIGIRRVPVGIHALMAEIRRAVIAAGDAGYKAGRLAAAAPRAQERDA